MCFLNDSIVMFTQVLLPMVIFIKRPFFRIFMLM